MLDATTSPQHDAKASLIGGRFETLRSLGDGSFAVVYEAIDRTLDRRVALKLFNGYRDDERELALREARAMARLNHAHVLLVHDVGTHRGVPFLACEYAETDMRRWLAGADRDPAQILELFMQAGAGLAAAHRAGLVHHDFKPANVLLRADGSAAVGDFGLARHLDSQDDDTRHSPSSDHAFGTLMYISPERLLGLPGDASSDQFSFCVSLWEALAGQHPFTGADPQRRYDSIVRGPSGTPRAPAHVVRALRRGLAPHPEDRFVDMRALLGALATASLPRPQLDRKLRSTLSVAAAALVLALSLSLSREAPAVDFELTPSAVLTADAALEHARELAFAGDYAAVTTTLKNVMPLVRQTDELQRRRYLVELEVLGDLLMRVDANAEAAFTFAAAKNLAKDLGADQSPYLNKRALAQARDRRSDRATRGK